MARRVTLRTIAEMTGLSPAAVSLVARGQPGVGDETRQRVLDVMRQEGYLPRAGNGQRGETAGIIALVVEKLPLPVLADMVYAEVVGGMQAEARRQGFFLALHEVGGDEVAAVVADAVAGRLDGLLVLGGGDLTDAQILQMSAAGRPIVLVDNVIDGSDLDGVLPDHVAAGFVAADHLIRLGHRRIAFLTGPAKYKPLLNRLEGYLGALVAAGLPIEPALMPAPVSGTPHKGYLQMQALLALPEPPTAVVAVSDKSAIGALAALREANVRVPEEVAVVGIDDALGSDHTMPPLTTVAWSKRELGMLAVRQLVRRQSDAETPPLKVLTACQLVVRDSCGGRPLPICQAK